MDMKVDTVDACRKKITVTVPAERVADELEKTFRSLTRSVKMKGFRPGKAPRKVLELQYGAEVRKEVKKNLVSASLGEALEEKGINPVSYPELDIEKLTVKSGEAFRYEVDVEVWPEFRLGGYKGIRAVRKTRQVKDEDIEKSIENMREHFAESVPVEGRALRMGDLAVIDFTQEIDGKPHDERKGLRVELRAEAYSPGFCEQLEGMNPGETRSFTLALPDDLPDEKYRGKESSFTVTLHEIKMKRLPELNDEFCKGLGDYSSVRELREAVREEHRKSAEASAKDEVVEQLNAYLLKKNSFPLPENRLREETARIADNDRKQLAARGIDEQVLEAKKDEFLAAARTKAEEGLRLALIYGEISRKEKIAATDEEIDARIGLIAARVKQDPQQVRAALEKEGELNSLRQDIIRQKVAEFLMENAKIKDK